MNDTVLLLVGHGSRKREGNKEILHFAAQWRERHPGWRIETCFIEHADVLLDEGLDRAARDTRHVLATLSQPRGDAGRSAIGRGAGNG